jgi:DNA-binding response OmpR family regulator
MSLVLMVDDDPSQLRIRELILRGEGIAVTSATDADAALASLRSPGARIGLVITDHNLPGRNGADLVRELRLTWPELPVIVLSGMPGIEPEYEGLNTTFCYKPIPPQELSAVIHRLLPAEP